MVGQQMGIHNGGKRICVEDEEDGDLRTEPWGTPYKRGEGVDRVL